MHKVPGIYWPSKSSLTASLKQEHLHLNPQPVSSELARLKSLHSNTIGGLVLVTMHHHSDGRISMPYITIIAAPSLITLAHFSEADPTGIDFADFWDDSVLAPHGVSIPEGLHCPVLAVTEGFSCAVKLPGGIDFLSNAQPLFFPMGEHLTGQVPTMAGPVYHALFFPKVCDFPIGMAWLTTIGYEDFYSSIRGLKSGYSHFLTILTTLQPQLTAWLGSVHQTLTNSMYPSLPFLDIHPHGYPSFDTSEFPEAVLDS
jgi:hypothetical protein